MTVPASTVRAPVLSRAPVPNRAPNRAPVPSRAVVARATPEFKPSEEDFREAITYAVRGARELCETGDEIQCAIAWEVVEELSMAAADARPDAFDPIDSFCEDDPAAAECRVYDV